MAYRSGGDDEPRYASPTPRPRTSEQHRNPSRRRPHLAGDQDTDRSPPGTNGRYGAARIGGSPPTGAPANTASDLPQCHIRPGGSRGWANGSFRA